MFSLQGQDVTWVGFLGLKQETAAVQMLYVSGSSDVARGALRVHHDGSTSPIRIGQRMRLEQVQLEGVARKIQVSVFTLLVLLVYLFALVSFIHMLSELKGVQMLLQLNYGAGLW